MKTILAGLAAVTGFVTCSLAEPAFQASLFPDVALYDSTETINGLTLNIWGLNPQHAIALGLVNGSFGQSSGFSVGCINYSENYTGVQWGCLNVTRCDFDGWQAGWVNYTADVFSGFQFGWVNYAGQLRGLQFGLFNMAAQADRGLQIGLLNLLPENRQWFSAGLVNEVAPVMVLVNWRY